MRFDLAIMAQNSGYRRKVTPFRPIAPPSSFGEELARIYIENVKVWDAAAPGMIATYARAYAALQHDRAPALQSEIDAADEQTTGKDRLEKIATAVLLFMGRYERWHRMQWIEIVKRTSVDIGPFIGPNEFATVLENAMARNVALVKDISGEASGKISDIVFRGLQTKTPVEDVAADIQAATGFARKRSIRVAHDQLIKVSAALDTARMMQAGIGEFIWKHTPQKHPRLHHLARNGLVFKLGQPRGDEPGEAPFCRCYRVPILRLPQKN